ncbi:fibronectin type III domain-containing protein [Paenibacillus terreus]|uniref:Fibronectin type III domain-containing protein n=1 Tax=Paenibacillus terreus TaxID=1387834 RepID=A0ABV5B421_9BACL
MKKRQKIAMSLVSASLVFGLLPSGKWGLPISHAAATSWSLDAMHLIQAHQAGYTGKNVKIAIIGSEEQGKTAFDILSGDGSGFAGAAPGANIELIKVDGSGASTVQDVISGINQAVNNDMDIIYIGVMSDTGAPDYEAALRDAYNKGLLIVAPAGDEGTADGTGDNITYPAKYGQYVIAVGSVDAQMRRADSSSTGAELDFVAPGVNIETTTIVSGTLAAAAHVAGLLAVLKELHPTATSSQLQSELQRTAQNLGDPGPDPLYGFGFVSYTDDAAPDNIGNLNILDVTDSTARLSWTKPQQSDFSHVNIYNGADSVATGVSDATYELVGLSPDTDYSFTLKAVDNMGNESTGTNIKFRTASVRDNVPPMEVANLAVAAKGQDFIELKWDNPTDADFARNNIYKNGEMHNQTDKNSALITGLTPNTEYSFQVVTEDITGNRSQGSSITVMTDRVSAPSDTIPPADVTELAVTGQTTDTLDITFKLPADADFDRAVVFVDDREAGSTKQPSFRITGLTADKAYTIKVTAVDTSGNSSNGKTITGRTSATAPAAPDPSVTETSNLQVAETTTSTIKVSWTKSPDAAWTSLYLDGRWITDASGETYTFTGLAANTTYEITAKTKRTDGVTSPGIKVTAKTQAQTTTPSDSASNTYEVRNLEISDKSKYWLEIKYNIPSQSERVRIYVDDEYIGTTRNGTYKIDDLESGTRYDIRVTTVDKNGKESKGVKVSGRTGTSSSSDDDTSSSLSERVRELQRAKKKVAKAEGSLNRSDWRDAQDTVEDLPDGLNKEALLARLGRIRKEVFPGETVSNGNYSSGSGATTNTVSSKSEIIILTLDSTQALVNNNVVRIPQMPLVKNGVTLLPLRFVGETAGYRVAYTHTSKKITLSQPLEGRVVQLGVGEKQMTVSNGNGINNYTKPIEQPPIIVNSYTLVPLRVVGEASGYQVDYNPATRTITLTK